MCTVSNGWLAVSQLTPERLLPLLKPLPEPTTLVVHLYHCDHLGTPIALINTQGSTDWRAEFDPWGNQVDGSNPQRLYQPIRMQGQHYDEESDMHYNRHRYYDPALGRYISQDPIGLAGGWNLYSYPLDPVSGIDPLGLNPVAGAIGGFAVGGPPGAVIGAILGVAAGVGIFTLATSDSESKNNREGAALNDIKQSEYERAKTFCDKKPEQGKSDCASLSKAIDHAKMCASLYENWDAKWFPGRHDIKIDERKIRIQRLSKKHREECTNK